MPKVIYAAFKRHPPSSYHESRPHNAYELLQVGKANAPLENDRAFRHRLFNKYGAVPDCLVLETIKPEHDPRVRRAAWQDVFNFQLEFDPVHHGHEDDVARSKRLVKFWTEIVAESTLVPGNALPAPQTSARVEVHDPAVVALLRRLAVDRVKIVGFSAEPGEPAVLILSADHPALSQLMADLNSPAIGRESKSYLGGLLAPAPGV